MRFKQERKRIIATFDALNRKSHHEKLIRAHPQGRRSVALREEGLRLRRGGDLRGFHAKQVEAAELFELSDRSPAAAATWFELANALIMLPDGPEEPRLLEAERIVERALACKERRRAPLRYAMTLDLMAQCLRRIATHLPHEAAAERESEARKLYDKAIKVALGAGFIGELEAAGYIANLGNLLNQMGELASASRRFEIALDTGLEACRWLERPGRSEQKLKQVIDSMKKIDLAHLELLLAGSLAELGRIEDRIRVERLVKSVINRTDVGNPLQSRARLLHARAKRLWGDLEAARAILRGIDSLRVHFEGQVALIEEWHQLGDVTEGARIAVICREDAINHRLRTITDFEADHYASRAQIFAALWARAVMGDEPETAFVQLDNFAAPRFSERISTYTLDRSDPITAVLADRRQRLSKRAVCLAEGPARFSPLHDKAVQRHLRVHLDRLRAEILPDLEVEEIMASKDPIERLRALAREAEQEVRPVVAALRRRHNTLGQLVLEGLGLRSLSTVFDAHADLVLLRVRLEEPSMAIAAWQGGCVSAALECPTQTLRSLLAEPWEADTIEALSQSLAPILSIIPEMPDHRLVVLPSSLAAFVPWPAVEYDGRPLLDRFRSISQLPNLDPLLQTQRLHQPREGAVLVAPGFEGGTRCHDAAFASRRGRRLFEAEATTTATLAAASTADVIAFYGHGSFRPDKAAIQLASREALEVSEIGDSTVWMGCERVELWACNSGVNRSLDWLTPPGVNEGFGIDMVFHQSGVRSTIGTLWPVSDFSTGQIAGRFGELVDEGMPADEALAEAQRWWRNESIPRLRAYQSTADLKQYLKGLGVSVEADDILGRTLGEEPVATWVDRLEAPRYWAGFRFVGVANAPREVCVPATLDDDAVEAAERWLAEHAPADPLAIADDEVAKLRAEEGPVDAARGLRVARLLQSIQTGARPDQLLRALAWVDEARAATRTLELDLEAAWISLLIGIGEWPFQTKSLHSADSIWLAHTERLLKPYEGPIVAAITAGVRAHEHRGPDDSVHPFLAQLFESVSEVDDSVWRLRLLILGADLLSLDDDRQAEWLETILVERAALTDAVVVALWNELEARRYYISHMTGAGQGVSFAAGLVTDEGIACSIYTASAQAALTPIAEKNAQEALGEELTELEDRYWGRPYQDFVLTSTTGTPGPAWQLTVGNYVSAKVETAPQTAIAHLIASIHMGSDIRLAVTNSSRRMAALTGSDWISEVAYIQRIMPRWRDAITGMLVEGRDPATYAPDEPHDADSLAVTASWPLQATLHPAGRTLTFCAGQLWHSLSSRVGRGSALDEIRSVCPALAPPRRLIAGERWIKTLPSNTIILAGILDGASRLVLIAFRQMRNDTMERSWRTDQMTGLVLAHALVGLLATHPDAVDRERLSHWATIRKIIEPGLPALLDNGIIRGAEHLLVLMPGALRQLPWGGLRRNGRPLFKAFRSVIHLPTLGFAEALKPSGGPILTILGDADPNHAALVGQVDTADDAFRASTPAEDRRIEEVDAVEARPDWGRIRLYGAPSAHATGSLSGVSLPRERAFLPRNLDETKLGHCSAVEVWAAPNPWSIARDVHSHRDALPRMVKAGLETGASGVLDIAWPVPERLKVLVYVRHSAACRATQPPAEALVTACREVLALLQSNDAARQSQLAAWGCSGVEVCSDDGQHIAAFRWWGGPPSI